MEGADDTFDVLHQLAFGELQLEEMRLQVGFLEYLAHQAGQIALTQLMHRQVHRDADLRQPLTLPFARLPARLTQDELTDGCDQAGFLGQADEVAGGHQTQQRMTPTHQRLGTIQAVIGQA